MDQKVLDDSVDALRELFLLGQIKDDDYHKLIVESAYEYAVAGAMDKALELLREIPLRYYESVQKQQLLQDSIYAERALALAQALLDANIVGFGPGLDPTQAPGNA